MTEKEKAKAYDDALKKARQLCDYPTTKPFISDLQDLFPELKESKDERIRKVIIGLLKQSTYEDCDYDGVNMKDIYAWLEKQDERKDNNKLVWKHWSGCGVAGNGDGTQIYLIKQYNTYSVCSCLSFECDYILLSDLDKLLSQKFEMKSAEESLGISSEEYNDIVNECLYGESKTVDKVKPKFKNGQWIVWQDKCYKVNYNGCGYELIDQNGLSTSLEYGTVDTSARLWNTTKDAKDGDVLASDNSIFIFQEEYIAEKPIAYCGLMNGRFLVDGEDACWTNERYYPATKEQRDALMKAMTDAGWEFDFEKKELKKISQRMLSAEAKEALYDKSVWNEDDDMLVIVEGWLDTLCEYLEDSSFECIPDVEFCINWIKSLKDRAQSKQEWSKEDETKMHATLAFIKSEFPKKGNEEIMEDTIEWLKSIKTRITWKPSDAQIEALGVATDICSIPEKQYDELNKLYHDLKKLAE